MSLVTKPPAMTPMGYQQATVTAKTALTIPAGATLALIKSEAQTVRWTDDSSNPTATVGMPMLVGDPPLWFSGELATLQFIAASAGGIINVSYYKIT